MSVNNSEMKAKYSSSLPCKSCKFCLPNIGKYSQAESAFCEKYPNIQNKKPSGVLFRNEPCRYYEEAGSNEDSRVDGEDTKRGVGVLVIKDGKILTGMRRGNRHGGEICGPGGHVKDDETDEEAAIRETEEEFGITPTTLVKMEDGLYLCTDYTGAIKCADGEMKDPEYRSLDEIREIAGSLFQPFAHSIFVLLRTMGAAPQAKDRFEFLH